MGAFGFFNPLNKKTFGGRKPFDFISSMHGKL